MIGIEQVIPKNTKQTKQTKQVKNTQKTKPQSDEEYSIISSASITGRDNIPGSSVIFLSGLVDSAMAANFHSQLVASEASGDQFVIVRICSPGGCVSSGIAIYDAITTSPLYVITECWGACESMASIILQAGKEQYISANSRVMIHNSSAHIDSAVMKYNDLDDFKKRLSVVNRMATNILSAKTKQDKKTIRGWMKEERIFNAKECLKFGLVDGVIAKTIYNVSGDQ